MSFRFSVLALALATPLCADLVWLDFQAGELNTAPLHAAFPAMNGTVREVGGISFTLIGDGVGSRDRGLADAMLSDFAFIDGDGSRLRLRIEGLSASSYEVESWHYDGGGFAGAVRVEVQRVGEETLAPLVANHAFSTTSAKYTFTADGTSSYELVFTENDANNRVRLNGLRLRKAGEAQSLPGRFIDVDGTNTAAVGGTPDPFWTDSATDSGFTSGPLWRRRTGFGFNVTGHREIFEKDANGGIGDAAPLVTTVTGLEPGRSYGAHVAFISVPTESWQVKAGLAEGVLTLFTPTSPPGKIVNLGTSAEPNSNRSQYLGFVGNITADSSGTVRLFADDGDGTAANFSTRTWFEGFFLGDPIIEPPLPGGAVEIAPDGAWTWFNDERAIIHQGSLFSGYVKSDGHVGITRYVLATGETFHTVLSTSRSQQRDDHNNPSITVLPDGRLMALYAKHIAAPEFYQRTSLVPLPSSLADWGPELVRPVPANNTYNNTYRLSAENNAIYNFHRSINFNPTLTISNDLGETWQPSRQFLGTGGGNVRPYPRYVSNGVDRIDLIYTDGHPRDVNNSVYHLYYHGGQLRKTDGTLIDSLANIPLDHDGGERGSVIYQYRADAWGPGDGPNDWIPTGRGWTWDIHYGADGHPVCVFQVQRDDVTGSGWNHDRIYYYYARWTGTGWQKRFIAHAGRGIYSAEDDYGGGMCIDPEDPRVVYISSNAANPFALDDISNVPLRAGERYEIWRGFTGDGGLTFTWTQITENSLADNLRPIVPEKHGRSEFLVWFHGTYTTYTNYSTRVLGRIGTPLASYDQWRVIHGVAGGPNDDDDGDGLSNFLEFALGGDPTNAMSRPAPLWAAGGFAFSTASAAGGLEWRIESSANLVDWNEVAVLRPGELQDWFAAGYSLASDPMRLMPPAPDEAGRRFMRMRAVASR
jgi:hypothetical protein